MTRRAITVLVSLLTAAAVRADQIETYSFIGTLVTPLANQSSVTGYFNVDRTTLVLTDYSFTTPAGVVNPPDDTSDPPLQQRGAFGTGRSLIFFDLVPALQPSAFELLLAFPGSISSFGNQYQLTFGGGPLYTGPISGIKFFYSSFSCSICGPNGYSSYFTDGMATLVPASVPEPSTSTLFLVCCLVSAAYLVKRVGFKSQIARR